MSGLAITNVSDYIGEINSILEQKDSNSIIVFRGEERDFGETSCIPNIYRNKSIFSDLKFEKNLFDEMRANGLCSLDSYLVNAVDAQHGGFPSRLLDVTYNCLVALFFACTPYYKSGKTTPKEDDGCVYVFELDKMFCATSDNISRAYNEIVDRRKGSFINHPIFSKNHKLIDHIKSNKRIIAQQGAFILFQGDNYEKLPDRICSKIIIDGQSKKNIQNELKMFFGIDTGSMYPQTDNLVLEMVTRSKNINNLDFCVKNEFKILLRNIESELDYYISKLCQTTNRKGKYEYVLKIEKCFKDYNILIPDFINSIEDEEKNNLKPFIDEYNQIVLNTSTVLDIVMKRNDVIVGSDYIIERMF